jgi:hypothetical protein
VGSKRPAVSRTYARARTSAFSIAGDTAIGAVARFSSVSSLSARNRLKRASAISNSAATAAATAASPSGDSVGAWIVTVVPIARSSTITSSGCGSARGARAGGARSAPARAGDHRRAWSR